MLVVAAHQYSNPVWTIVRDQCDLADTLPLGQQPDDMKMTPFDWINRLPIAVGQFIQAEMSGNRHVFRHRLPFLL